MLYNFHSLYYGPFFVKGTYEERIKSEGVSNAFPKYGELIIPILCVGYTQMNIFYMYLTEIYKLPRGVIALAVGIMGT